MIQWTDFGRERGVTESHFLLVLETGVGRVESPKQRTGNRGKYDNRVRGLNEPRGINTVQKRVDIRKTCTTGETEIVRMVGTT